MIVMKFGGSSVANYEAMLKVKDIVLRNSQQKVLVVLSACKGITDSLINICDTASRGNLADAFSQCDMIHSRHSEIIESAGLNNELKNIALTNVSELIDQLKNLAKGISLLKEQTRSTLDQCLSFGERLSTLVFYYLTLNDNMSAELFAAENVMLTDDNFGSAVPILPAIRQNAINLLLPIFAEKDIIITQGFIGKTEAGRYTTLGRGGSDFSAALFGYACSADEIQIWTDVSGVLSTDPRLISQAVTINRMSADEIRELSFFGAKVLHPDTIKPAVSANIPIKVLNTFEPANAGTTIVATGTYENAGFHSFSAKPNTTAIKISLLTNISADKQLINILSAFAENGMKLLSSSTTESSITLFLDDLSENHNARLTKILLGYKWHKKQGVLICLVGNSLSCNPEMFGKLANSLLEIPVEYLLYGNNNESVFIFVDENDAAGTLKSLHNLIIERV